jgi:hypothetical protein
MRAKVLLLDTDFVCELRGVKIKDGKVNIDDKEFDVDNSRPFILRTGLTKRPLYILKWNSLRPAEFTIKHEDVKPQEVQIGDEYNDYVVVTNDKKGRFRGKKNDNHREIKKTIESKYDINKYHLKSLESIDPDFEKSKKITPAILRDTADLRFIKQMKKYSSGGRKIDFGNILFIIIVLCIIAFGLLMAFGKVGV